MTDPSRTFKIQRLTACGLLLACVSSAPAASPTFSTMPTLSSAVLVADDTTEYTVLMKVSDGDGYDDIRCLRTLFNYSEAGGDRTQGRGYLAWGKSDADLLQYGGTWVLADATGGGRWGYQTDAWGGTDYMTPVSCVMAPEGKASGGTGSRTVTWAFRVKPAWAHNPVVNDADAWAADGGSVIGWRDNASEFDVVPAPCNGFAATPRAPIVSTPTCTTLDVTLDPADSDQNLYAIRVSPEYDGRAWVQTDGRVAAQPAWQTRADWATTTMTGLAGGLTYGFRVRAMSQAPGICPSSYGPSASGITAPESRTIRADQAGVAISKGIIGNATRLDAYPNTGGSMDRVWEIVGGSSVRGIAGGMDADTYNWKDMSGQGVGHSGTPGPDVPTTLMWMRRARDHRPAMPVITVNTRGTGPLSSSGWCTFYYTDTSLPPLIPLAADWVRYVNFILPAYREGDTLPAGDQAIVDSITWYGRPRLLLPGETSTPRVDYWEIGNEPELTLPWCTPGQPTHTLSAGEYATRYKQISAAMLAVDPAIKVGPCTIGETYAYAVLADPAARVDFVSYHPYGPLYWFANAYGDTAATAESGLRYIKKQQVDRCASVRNNIARAGRDPDVVALMASEWNPSSWEWECSGKDRRVSHALGIAETLFTFAELRLAGAHYWSHPTSCSSTTEAPGYKVFQMLQQHMGDRLIDSFTDGLNFRLYVTRDSQTHDLAIWCLNFSETENKTIELGLTGLDLVDAVRLKTLANLSGDTSLLNRNDSPASVIVDWTERTLTGLDLSRFMMTVEDATLAVLVIEQTPAARADYDRDGDVDQADFGYLQSCLSGSTQLQPPCLGADLNGDSRANLADIQLFKGCLSGPGIGADLNCIP